MSCKRQFSSCDTLLDQSSQQNVKKKEKRKGKKKPPARKNKCSKRCQNGPSFITSTDNQFEKLQPKQFSMGQYKYGSAKICFTKRERKYDLYGVVFINTVCDFN